MSDALKANVKIALNKRGGFREVYSRNGSGPIKIEIKFRNDNIEGKRQPLITYSIAINLENGVPVVLSEVLKYRRGQHGKPYSFLDFRKGVGTAITNEVDYFGGQADFEDKREEQRLDSPDILASKGLGQFQKFQAISSFRRLLDSWFVSNFQIQASRRQAGLAAVYPPKDTSCEQKGYYHRLYCSAFGH